MGELCPVMTSYSGLSCLGALSRSFLLGPYVGQNRTTTVQVNRITKIAYVVFLLIMLAGSCIASPRVEDTEKGSAVYFKSRFCQPISESELRRRMGGSFDRSHMSHSDDSMKRSASDIEGSDFEEDEDEDSEFFDTVDDEVSESDIIDYSEGDAHPHPAGDSTTHTPIYNFMRKKRDIADDLDDNTLQQLLLNKDKRGGDVDLHLQLLLSGKNKKARKQLKKKIRAKVRKNLFKKPPPWECKMKPDWQRMKTGFFPTYVQTGRCQTSKCFYRLYDCIPKKYAIKLLKRDPDQCNPIPTIGLNATYEERWFFVRHYVTLASVMGSDKNARKGDIEQWGPVYGSIDVLCLSAFVCLDKYPTCYGDFTGPQNNCSEVRWLETLRYDIIWYCTRSRYRLAFGLFYCG
ncbi:hypothetical protein LOTGIDRAFT_234654 [Lottia gigantea]|uniref:Uncharacterized protein n=1 Tax=Lottia gigantea TaxID=225164 RepID=V4BIC7_LOTGI|nr:hypothetical protein LOTGIDRAFT_234654 [Lottia gigantea]ESO88359.1 hypothetical protein LOTGIDRAFT_234654 [Lottia gigantea]